MKNKASGEQQFDVFYQNMYQKRWEKLKEALLQPTQPVSFDTNLKKPYFLDHSSIEVASLLPIKGDDMVLDMCAAPGGKTLILATQLGEGGALVSNDRSSARRNRLHSVLNEHLLPSYRERVIITSHDATKWSLYEQNKYDAILLDAPCSSERHLLQNPKTLQTWSASRTKRLGTTQFAMLAAALEAVKIGGYILYSTCSISHWENEDVISKLTQRRANRFEEISIELSASEALSHGLIILPDQSEGRGPLFATLLRRLS